MLENIKIYPNPTANQVTISGISLEMNTIKLYNLIGQDFTSLIDKSSNNSSVTVDLSHLKSGLYLIKIKSSIAKILKK